MAQESQYGCRLMPQVLAEIGQHCDRTFAVTILSGNQGYQEIKFSAVARAVDWLAFRLQSTLGVGDRGRETIAYFGLSDLRYTIVFLAGVKCGYKVKFNCYINLQLTRVIGPSPVSKKYSTSQ